MVQHYCSICLPEFARRRVCMYVCARIQTHTHKKGFSPYKINIYLSHASLVRGETLSNSIQSFSFSLSFASSLSLFFSLTVNSEREGEKQRGRAKTKSEKKNLHQIAIRRVLRRVTFRNRHIYIYLHA